MRIYENSKIGDEYVDRARKRLGKQRSWDEIHASDITQCLRRSTLNRLDPKPLPRDAVVRFAAGYGIQEFFLGEEEESVPVEGVLFSADGLERAADGNPIFVLEFKTTGAYRPKFDDAALRSREGWLFRTALYCAVHGVKTAHFMIYFLYQRDFKTFTVIFSDQDLVDAWRRSLKRRDILTRAFTARGQKLPGPDTRIFKEECLWCPYLVDYCPEQVAETRK